MYNLLDQQLPTVIFCIGLIDIFCTGFEFDMPLVRQLSPLNQRDTFINGELC